MCSSRKSPWLPNATAQLEVDIMGPGWNMRAPDKVLVSSWLPKHLSWEARRPEGKGYFCSCIVKKAEELGYIEDTQTTHGAGCVFLSLSGSPVPTPGAPPTWEQTLELAGPTALFSFPRWFQYSPLTLPWKGPMSSKDTSILAPALYHEVGVLGWVDWIPHSWSLSSGAHSHHEHHVGRDWERKVSPS